MKTIKSLGNTFLAERMDGALYMIDLNTGGKSLTNQLGTTDLYLALHSQKFAASILEPVVYVDSMGEIGGYWGGKFQNIDTDSIEFVIMQDYLFKNTKKTLPQIETGYF